MVVGLASLMYESLFEIIVVEVAATFWTVPNVIVAIISIRTNSNDVLRIDVWQLRLFAVDYDPD